MTFSQRWRKIAATPIAYWRSFRESGLPATTFARLLLDRRRPLTLRTRTAQASHPLLIRAGTSDTSVFRQIFAEREYAPLECLDQVDLVIDLGANVGYSSAWFLSRWPKCRVVAVEPDPGNHAILERNLAPYGTRAIAVCAGAWSRTHPLEISDTPYRDGREWSRQVREATAGRREGLIAGVDVPALMALAGAAHISVLKCDIEGAEAEVFGPTCEAWLDCVDAIAIELHDDTSFGDASGVFLRAISGRPFDVVRSGELLICRRRT